MFIARAKPEKVHLITIEELAHSGLDDEGITTNEWREVRQLWASMYTRSYQGAQQMGEGQYNVTDTSIFTYNWIPGWQPTASMRLRFNGELYDIQSVNNVQGDNREVEIRATKNTPAQGVK